jgi:type II secretion system protein C
MRTVLPAARVAGPALALALAACGGASPPIAAPTVPKAATAQTAAFPALEHRLARSAVHDVVAQGLGVFLQRIELSEQPVFAGGRFHGFRIASLHDDAFWAGVDLRPGDVVVSVNGFPIEHPEQAETAFESLDVASELHVAYERDGKPRDLVYAIVDDR